MTAAKRKWDQFHSSILESVLWPNAILTCSPKELMSSRRREINIRGIGLKGAVYSPKLDREVPFESMNECKFLNLLEKMDDVVWYQEQPIDVSYQWQGKTRSYYPDFCVGLKDSRYFIAEVKQLSDVPQQQNAEKLRALWTFCKKNGLGLLVMEGTRPIRDLCEQPVDSAFRDLVLDYLDRHGSISEQVFNSIKARIAYAEEQLPALVLEERLIWQQNPFSLISPNVAQSGEAAG